MTRAEDSSPKSKNVSKTAQKGKTPKDQNKVQYSKVYVTFLNIVLNLGIVGQIVLTLYSAVSGNQHWLFHYSIFQFIRVAAVLLELAFALVYVWSVYLLKGRFRYMEGHGIPNKIVSSGPYSEVSSRFLFLLCISDSQFRFCRSFVTPSASHDAR
jgi:hypothetical protein